MLSSDTHPHAPTRIPSVTDTMATRTLEARFERMSVNDENDPGENARLYQKTKVCSSARARTMSLLSVSRGDGG